jgi:hypothetical protein
VTGHHLSEHFALAAGEGPDEDEDWRPFLPGDVLEGELLESPSPHFGWANRWRRLAVHPDYPGRGRRYEIELHAAGDHVRVRLPFRFDRLPHDGDVIVEPSPEGFQRRWFERVGDETHMVIEAIK